MSNKRKPKRGGAPAPSSEAANASSAEHPGAGRPWTDEEMAAAKPLPLPTGEATASVSSGVPHTGTGQTEPAGRPEADDEAAR
ncbi:hypothetical protein FTUN_7893 [Frigoriglobus tundricola]|uniref:Uncharacterized protein n=1 Tax=Frigoriglobus tundricola TaxID=2774151 RepID=A0A6M5Z1H9_9BACT|nr:hypothetical protein FTUN_7893 [Frigoriglobus tundricola]